MSTFSQFHQQLRPDPVSARSQKEGRDGGAMRDIINVASEGWQWPTEEPPHSDKLSAPRVDEAEKQRWRELAAEEWRKAHAPSVEEVFEARSPEENRVIEAFKQEARPAIIEALKQEVRAAKEFEAPGVIFPTLILRVGASLHHGLSTSHIPPRPSARTKRRDWARFDANLQRAFDGLLCNLKRAYGQPAPDACAQHVVALTAIANFLRQMGPDCLAHEAGQFIELAQMFQGLDDGIYVLSRAKRSDEMRDWLARACVALAVADLQRRDYTRTEAAKWAAKKYPGLKALITEGGSHRSLNLEKTIISWCKDFSRRKLLRNEVAHRVYRTALDELKASNCNSDQLEYADWLLQQALRLRSGARRMK
jgi:hypothetical protein